MVTGSKQDLNAVVNLSEITQLKSGDIYISGLPFYGRKYISPLEFKRKLKNTDSIESLSNILKETRGSFTVVKNTGDRILAAAGPSQSNKPIFYSKIDQGYLTDKFQWLINQIPVAHIADSRKNELLLSGYIHGSNTLHPNIQHLQAGEVLSIQNDGLGMYKTKYYYKPPIKNQHRKSNLVEMIEMTLDDIFSRLKTAIPNEPIILSLSGGYDSRLAALMLYKHGFENVYAYCTNTQSSYDIEISKRVSERLGFDWTKFEYSSKELRDVYESSYWHKFNNIIGDCGTTRPRPSEVLTIQRFEQDSSLPDSGIFIDGNSPADSVGNFFSRSLLNKSNMNKSDVEQAIRNKYYTNSAYNSEIENQIRGMILERVDIESEIKLNAGLGLLTRYFWEYRHNTMKQTIIDAAGYNLIHPFLSVEFFQLYNKVPPEGKYQRNLFEDYTEKLNEEYLNGLVIGRADTGISSIKNKLEKRVSGTLFAPPAKKMTQYLTERGSFDAEQFQKNNIKYSFMSPERIDQEYEEDKHYSFYYAKDEITRSKLRPDGAYIGL